MSLPAVQHWIVCRRAQVTPPVAPYNPYTLKGVSYRYAIPATVGMSAVEPHPAKMICVFARFFGGRGPADFEIQVAWLDDPAPKPAKTKPEVYGPTTIHFRPTEPVRDYLFRLRNVPLYGPGRYTVRLFPVAPDVRRDPLAIEYFEVVQV